MGDVVADNCLCVKSISKAYHMHSLWGKTKSVHALQGVSFSLTPGLYGLLGPNGAGKSTLIHILTGNQKPDKGKVLWNGKSIFTQGIAFRRILGYMPQQQTLYNTFTGRRFLSYFCNLKEIPTHEIGREIERISTAVNLASELDKRLYAYSGGMKQRLLAAVAMIGSPQIIILDEPTAGLDPKERVNIRRVMKEYASEAIVLFATHVVSDIETVADSIILLNQGKIASKDEPGVLIEQYAPGCDLEEVYLRVFNE